MKEPTGPELIRTGIERDRGGRLAPSERVTFICGEGEVPEGALPYAPLMPHSEPLRDRVLGALANAVMCPGCLCLRFGLGHLTRKLTGIDCEHM